MANSRYRRIEDIRANIISLRQRNYTWNDVCISQDIMTRNGKPNPKLAQEIAYKTVTLHGIEQPYEPHDPDVRERLGLKPMCSECGRAYRNEPASRKPYVSYKALLTKVAMPVLNDIAHANNLSGEGRRQMALNLYRTLKNKIGE